MILSRVILHTSKIAFVVALSVATHSISTHAEPIVIDPHDSAQRNSRLSEEQEFFSNLIDMQPFIQHTTNGIPFIVLENPPEGFINPDKDVNSEKASVDLTIVDAYNGTLIAAKSSILVRLKLLPAGVSSAVFHAAQHGGKYRYYIHSSLIRPWVSIGLIEANTPIVATIQANFASQLKPKIDL